MTHFLYPARNTRPGPAHFAKRFLSGLVVFLVLSAPVLCRAQDPVTLDPIVITAEKIEDFRKNNPEQVVEMNREEIRKGNFGGLDQVLNAMPGVDVKKAEPGPASPSWAQAAMEKSWSSSTADRPIPPSTAAWTWTPFPWT